MRGGRCVCWEHVIATEGYPDGPLHDRQGSQRGRLASPEGLLTILPKQNAAFVAAMEDVLGVYARPTTRPTRSW